MKLFHLNLIITLLIISAEAFGNYPYLYMRPEDVKISDEQFRRSIRPYLRGMTNDFKLFLPKINPIAARVLTLHTEIITVRAQWEKRMKNCDYSENESCIEVLRVMYNHLKSIDQLMNQIDLELIRKNNPLDSALAISGELSTLANLSYGILHEIELILITEELSHYPFSAIEKRIAPFLWELITKSQFMIAPLMPPEIKGMIENVWFFFFREIEIYVVHLGDKEYLINHLEELNMAWHVFNNIVSRGSIPIFKPYIKELTSIHYQWNSILRMFLPHNPELNRKKPDTRSGLSN